MIDVKHALEQALTLLEATSPSARLDAEILLAFALAKSRAFLHAHPEATMTPAQDQAYAALLTKRVKGTPIAYLTGIREFWSLPLQVSMDTLIPRPETELLVELTLSLLGDKPHASILDLGTGSGAIALALASERPNWQILASDISQGAVNAALDNAAQLDLHNVHVYCSDWFENIPSQQFHAIVSNPPYIAALDPHLKQGDVRFEPRQALVSGADGLDALTYLIKHSYEHLLPGGLLLLEHGFEQKQAVITCLDQCGYQAVQNWQDWQGNDRVSGGWRKVAVNK